jgi:hypothetical protein
MRLIFEQDPYYCAYFKNHPSSWKLLLSDPLRAQLSSSLLKLLIDDTPAKMSVADLSAETLTIHLPSGTGTHTWKLETTSSKQP